MWRWGGSPSTVLVQIQLSLKNIAPAHDPRQISPFLGVLRWDMEAAALGLHPALLLTSLKPWALSCRSLKWRVPLSEEYCEHVPLKWEDASHKLLANCVPQSGELLSPSASPCAPETSMPPLATFLSVFSEIIQITKCWLADKYDLNSHPLAIWCFTLFS